MNNNFLKVVVLTAIVSSSLPWLISSVMAQDCLCCGVHWPPPLPPLPPLPPSLHQHLPASSEALPEPPVMPRAGPWLPVPDPSGKPSSYVQIDPSPAGPNSVGFWQKGKDNNGNTLIVHERLNCADQTFAFDRSIKIDPHGHVFFNKRLRHEPSAKIHSKEPNFAADCLVYRESCPLERIPITNQFL